MDYSNIAVIVPCYNEAMTIGKVVDDFHRELPGAIVYVYDNNSSDETSQIAKQHGATVRNEPRQGKGNVCRQMFRDIDAECYLMVDGDDTYPAEAAKSLCEPILNGEADMTVGDRLSNGTYAEENKRAFHGFGNNLVRAMIKWIYGYSFDDVMTGYRAIGTLFKDYRPLKFFSLVAIIFAIIGLALGIPIIAEYFQTGLVARFPTAILAVSFMFLCGLSLATGLILDSVAKVERKQWELQVYKTHCSKTR